MMISLIAAHDPNLVIGKSGRLPWHYSEDLRHFKQRTMGYPVVMGRRVFEELEKKPLPGRRNVVLSRTRNYSQVEICRNTAQCLDLLKEYEKIYIIGGAGLYRIFLPVCHSLEITLIRQEHDGDTYFPEYRNQIGTYWQEVSRVEKKDLVFLDYQRMVAPDSLQYK